MSSAPVFARAALVLLFAGSPLLFAAQKSPSPRTGQKAAEHMRLARQYLTEKKPEQAIPELRAVLQLEPNNVSARANLGVLLFFNGSYAEAIPQLRAALAAQPSLAKIQALLGMSEKRSGDFAAAQGDLRTAFPLLTEKKIHLQAGLELVETDQALGLLDKAAAIVSELRTTYPDNAQVLGAAYQIYSQAMSESLLSLAVAAPDSAELHFIMGQRLVYTGKTDEALAQFRQALAKNPNLPGLHSELAQLYTSSSDPVLHAQAVEEYKAALKVNPTDKKALAGLAGVEADTGATAAAASDYSNALKLDPTDAEALTGLAKVLVTMNEKPKATALLEHAVQLDPTNITAHYRLSTLYRQQGRTADAKQQLADYEHYKAVKAELEEAFQKMRTTPVPTSPNP